MMIAGLCQGEGWRKMDRSGAELLQGSFLNRKGNRARNDRELAVTVLH
jgi:hypothetical protein